jgi:hypothetical protein
MKEALIIFIILLLLLMTISVFGGSVRQGVPNMDPPVFAGLPGIPVIANEPFTNAAASPKPPPRPMAAPSRVQDDKNPLDDPAAEPSAKPSTRTNTPTQQQVEDHDDAKKKPSAGEEHFSCQEHFAPDIEPFHTGGRGEYAAWSS